MVSGKERGDLLVPTGFMLPGFEYREEFFEEGRQHCVFWSPTGYAVDQRMIKQEVVVYREIGEPGFGVEAGIDAGGSWWERDRLIRASSGNAGENLRWIGDEVAKVEDTHFVVLAAEMQREFERGLEFAVELKSMFLARFPGYNQVFDRYNELKRVMFVKDLQEVIVWRIDRGEFSVSVGEVARIEPGEEYDMRVFTYEGGKYWCHDETAVWYPTRKRTVAYNPDDTVGRTYMLQLSFATLGKYLNKRR